MKRSRWKWAASATIGIVIGLGVYTFRFAEGASYFSNNPKSCVNCHVMNEPYDGWQKASHHTVAVCNDCHVPHDVVGKYLGKAEHGFWHSYGFTFQNFAEPIRMKERSAHTVQQNCIECHADLVHHIVDRGSAADSSNNCIRCHAQVGHGPRR